MSRVHATTNPTNLIEIARKDISLSRSEGSEGRHFQISKLDFKDYGFSGDELVIVVARAGSTSLRFSVGTVAEWRRDSFSLDGLDRSATVKFRILVRSPGSARLVAAAENVRCVGDGDVESLMPISSVDLGQRVWSLTIDDDGVELLCNERVFPSGAGAEAYAPFRALVVPEALRRVVEHLASDPAKLEAEGSVWAEWANWMRVIGIELPPPSDETLVLRWIEDSTGRFCDVFKSVDDLKSFVAAGEQS